jgi:hypothetical protein
MKNAMIGSFAKFGPVSRAMVAAIALASAAAPAHAVDSNAARIAEGLKIAPVPLDFKGLDKNSVGLGSYLVTVGQCNGCHSHPPFAPGSDPFHGDPKTAVVKSAYFAGGVFFGGTLCSSNITRDRNGLPNGLTLAHFISALQTGHDFRDKPKVLLETMPWPYFRYMTKADLTAMYDYLRAIPPEKEPKCP